MGYSNDDTLDIQPYAPHWDGSAWKRVPSPQRVLANVPGLSHRPFMFSPDHGRAAPADPKEGRMSKLPSFALIAVFALVAVPSGAQAAPVPSPGACNPPPPPPMPPANQFVGSVTNRYFPLPPGTTFMYRGQEEGDHVVDRVKVTRSTKTVLGIRATVVFDAVAVNGQRSEKTFDWYAQDRHGNVWYLGESAFDFVQGHWVHAEDSWEAGHDGARAGIIMEAHPKVGDVYAQEDLPGTAMDMARVETTHATVTVPYGTFSHALKTHECTPLEPGVLDVKLYGRGIGEVAEATVRGGSSILELVSITSR
jgi:hypothetical protein